MEMARRKHAWHVCRESLQEMVQAWNRHNRNLTIRYSKTCRRLPACVDDGVRSGDCAVGSPPWVACLLEVPMLLFGCHPLSHKGFEAESA